MCALGEAGRKQNSCSYRAFHTQSHFVNLQNWIKHHSAQSPVWEHLVFQSNKCFMENIRYVYRVPLVGVLGLMSARATDRRSSSLSSFQTTLADNQNTNVTVSEWWRNVIIREVTLSFSLFKIQSLEKGCSGLTNSQRALENASFLCQSRVQKLIYEQKNKIKHGLCLL